MKPSRTCLVPDCCKNISRKHLMCLAHWTRVPVELQQRILAAAQRGHEAKAAKDRDAFSAAHRDFDAAVKEALELLMRPTVPQGEGRCSS